MLAVLLAVLTPLHSPLFAAAPSTKVAVLPVSAGEGITDKTAAALSDAVAAELRKLPGLQVITQQEIATLLAFDRQKALAGCQESSCLAEIGGALGADRLVSGTLSKLGESWMATLKLLDVQKAKTLGQADRRIRNGTIDDVLDQLGPMVAELFGTPQAVVARPAPSVAPATAPRKALAPPWTDEPMEVEKAKLKLATDGKGRYLAWLPGSHDTFWAGDATGLWAQRVIGYSAMGDTAYDYTFWEPRVKARWMASFAMKDGKFELHCGEKPLSLEPVADAEAAKLLSKMKVYQVRWKRRAHAIARDDSGNWFYVDRAREPEDSSDYRLYVGPRGKVEVSEVSEAVYDEGGELYLTAAGKLRASRKENNKSEAEWIAGAIKTPLVWLHVEDKAQFIYSELGAYAGQKLGTPCDPELTR